MAFGVSGTMAYQVVIKSFGNIVCGACIKTSVGAKDNVDIVRHGTILTESGMRNSVDEG